MRPFPPGLQLGTLAQRASLPTISTHRHMDEITSFIERIGEVRLLEELAAYFDYLAQDGLLRPQAEVAHIEALLDQLRGCIDWQNLFEPPAER